MPGLIDYVSLILQGSTMLLVLTVGLRTTWAEVTYLFQRPGLLARSILARNLVMPFAAVLLTRSLGIEPTLSAVLLALSISAVPPTLPRALLTAGGAPSYPIGLFASQSALAVVLVPASVVALNALLDMHARFTARQTVSVVGALTLAPLLAGVLGRHLAPRLSARVAPPLYRIALLLMIAALVLLVPRALGAWQLLPGSGFLAAAAVLIGIGITTGHALGGPRQSDRMSLGIASASSNPGLALAILSANMVQDARSSGAAVLLYLIMAAVATTLYRRAHRSATTHGFFRSRQRRNIVRAGADRRRVHGG